MGRQKVDVRREEILAATVAEIEATGMASLRVADIASSLGVSSGLVFYHFDTKDALLVAAFEFAVERDLARLDKALTKGSGTPVEQLSRILASYGPTGAATGWTIWIDAFATALREPSIRRSLRQQDKRWCSALQTAIEAGVASGDFVCHDPSASVSRIGAMLDGLTIAVLVYGSVTRAQLKRWVREATAKEIGVSADTLA
jgi:AcrR family transcriptional regulator